METRYRVSAGHDRRNEFPHQIVAEDEGLFKPQGVFFIDIEIIDGIFGMESLIDSVTVIDGDIEDAAAEPKRGTGKGIGRLANFYFLFRRFLADKDSFIRLKIKFPQRFYSALSD